MPYLSDLSRGYVVTGGGRGVGRAIVERLLGQDGYIAVIELTMRRWTGSQITLRVAESSRSSEAPLTRQ